MAEEMAEKKNGTEPECPEAETEAGTEESPAGAQAEDSGAEEKQAAGTEKDAAEPVAASDSADRERLLRLMAEFDNYKKRSARERENIYTDVRVDTVTRFLPVYDNLERALNAETADEAYKKGVEMTYQQLLDVFKKLGVEAIPAEGEKFDPALHNAVMHVEDESRGENEIVQELQKGFKLGEKVIRFSMVKVAN